MNDPNVIPYKNISLVNGRTIYVEEIKEKAEFPAVLISVEMAEINGLTIGDSFTLDNNLYFLPLDSPARKEKS